MTEEKQSFWKKPGAQTFLASVICALLGILLGFIILLIMNPAHAGEAIFAILKNFFKYSNNTRVMMYYFGSTLVKAVPAIICAEAILFAYKAGLFNIGAAGQYTIGLMVSIFCANGLHWPWYLCILAALVAGGLDGALCGFFKAFCNVNEVIAGIMLNWLALYLTNIVLGQELVMDTTRSETYNISETSPGSLIPSLGLGKLFGDNEYVTIAIILTIVIAIIIQIVLNKTTFGYELKATGHNKEAAKYAGMNAKRNIILTLVISGALAGLAASFYYLTGIENYKISSSVPDMGFNGIAIAFLGGLNPIGAIFAGFFVEHITMGGQYVNTNYYNPQVADLMVSIIIYLCGFVLFIKSVMNRPSKKKKSDAADIEKKANLNKSEEKEV